MNRDKNPKKKGVTGLLVVIAVLLLIVMGVMLLLISGNKEPEPTLPPETDPPVTVAPTAELTEPPTEAPTEPPATEPVMLDHMVEWYEKNQDVAAWLRIDDTNIDYPVVHTPEDEDKYLRADLDGNYSTAGTLLIDDACTMEPESTNMIVYGHNMQNGTMFRKLLQYKSKSFWEDHPTIYFSTLYDERTYEVMSVFYDRVYYNYEDVFKFYKFVDPVDEADFNNAMENYKEKALYDTGVTAEYGDKLLTLVTCSYHTKNGRFVVVAREVTEEELPVTETVAPEITETTAN